MTPVLILPLLLAPTAGVRIGVMGEGKLRFVVGRKVSTVTSATLSANAAGLLADEAGRAVTPGIRVPSGVLKIAMNGTVSVSGTKVGRLVLERAGADGPEMAFPGEEGMGLIQVVVGSSAPIKTTSAKPAATVVSIHAKNELTGDRVLLGTVADIQGDPAMVARLGAIDLGALPSLGMRRTLSPWALKAALRSQGIAESSLTINFPPDVMVARKGQTIEADTIVEQAKARLRQTIKVGDLNLSAGPAPLLVACGEVTFDTDYERSGQALVLTVRVSVDGKAAGQRILKFSAPSGGVKAGDTVRITLSRNGAVVQTEGKAKSAGFIGESIQVATTAGTTFSATITASGSVEVKL